LGDAFDKIYRRRFNKGEIEENVIDSMSLHGGYGAIKTDNGETIGFIPPDKGSEEELKKRFKSGEWQGF